MSDTTSGPDRYRRQSRCARVGPDGQARLGAACVVIVGLGALGSHLATWLARAGVGTLRLIDRDLVELDNLQRQILFDEHDAETGRAKAVAAAERLRRANSAIRIEAEVADVDAGNVLGLLLGADLLLDGSDGFATRFLLNDAARHLGLPWIYSGVIGTGGQVLAIGPTGPCLRCYVPELPPAGVLGTCETAGVIGRAVGAVTATAAALAMRYLVTGELATGRLHVLDVWTSEQRVVGLEPDPGCPTCAGRYETLAAERGHRATVLCGRNAVQLMGEAQVSLADLARLWEHEGRCQVTPYFTRLSTDTLELTVFADGRAIVRGTDDPARARAFFSRLVGI